MKQFPDEERKKLRELPLVTRIPEISNLVVCHASTRKDNDSIYAHTPESQLQEMFSNTSERFVIRAHNHVGQERTCGDRLIITCGSVGMPLDSHPTAQYLLLEQNGKGWHIRHQSVPYDVDITLRRFSETGYIDEAGPIARLLRREIATASHYVVPFLRAFKRWSDAGSISLDVAVDRFLNS